MRWSTGATVDQLPAFARMLLRGGDPVLSCEAVGAMCSGQLTEARKAHGGLGPSRFEGRSAGPPREIQAAAYAALA